MVLRIPAVQAASPHISVAYPFLHGEQSPGGVPIGFDSAGRLFSFDPWTWSEAGWLEAPTTLVLGRSGTSKSSLAKSYLWRLHRQERAAGRRLEVIILDPKREYERLALSMGLTQITLGRGGRAPLNPLASPDPTERLASGVALAEACLRRPLVPTEHYGLGVLFERLGDGAGIAELVDIGLSPPADAISTGLRSAQALAAAVRDPVLSLSRLVSGDMADMFGSGSPVRAKTGVVVRFGEGLGESVLAVAVVAIAGWLEAILAPGQDHRRVVLVDESWAALGEVAVTMALQRLAKLGRTRGVQLIILAHKASDFFGQAERGSRAYQQAVNLLDEPETRIIYGQASGELERATQIFGLAPEEADLVGGLRRAHALWRMGARSALVHHCLLAEEVRLVETGAGL
jgi:hypothetical protein